MNGQRFPFHRLPDNVRSEVLKTMDHHEIFFYSFLSNKARVMVQALQLHVACVLIRMEKHPTTLLQFKEVHLEDSYIEFTLKMPRSYHMMSSLNALPVSVEVKKSEERKQRIVSNQGMRLGEWIRHFKPFSIYIHVVFFIGEIKFDIPSLLNIFPKLHRIDINCLKNEPDERDILNAQNLLRAFLSNVQNVGLFRVPLRENFSLQHIAMANLKHLEVDYRSKMDFVDICSWNVESCMISTFSGQMSIRDLNRFFKLWIKGLNPMLKELSIYWPTEIIPDWNGLLKGLKSIETEAGEEEDDEDDEERGAKKYIIKNVHGINAIIKVMHLGGTIGVVKFSVEN